MKSGGALRIYGCTDLSIEIASHRDGGALHSLEQMIRFMGRCKKIFQVVTIFSLLVTILYASKTPSQIAAIEASWSSQKSSAATARITFYKTLIDCDELKLSVEDVVEIVDGLKSSRDENFRSNLIQKFNPKLFKKHQAHDQKKQKWDLWGKRTLINDGFRERSVGSDTDHVIARGLHLIHNQLNHEISCYERGLCEFHYHQLDWFLAVLPTKALQKVVSVEEGEGTQTLRWKSGSWLVVDAENQLPIEEEVIDSTGTIAKRVFFREFAGYPGDVMLPAIRIEVSFRDSAARHVMVTVVDDAQLNVDVPEFEFVLPAPAKSVMADLRNNQRKAQRIKQPVEDSAEFFLASAVSANVKVPTVAQSFNWKAFFLILNGLVLIVLGVTLWRRAK